MNLLIRCSNNVQRGEVTHALQVGLGYRRRFPAEYIHYGAPLVLIWPKDREYHVYSVLLTRTDRLKVTYEEMMSP